MADKRKSKGVLVKVNDLDDNGLAATLDKALDILFGEDEPIKPAKTKTVKLSSDKRKTPKGNRKKSKDN